MADDPELKASSSEVASSDNTEVAPSVQSENNPSDQGAVAFVDLFQGTELSAVDAEAVTLRSNTHLIVFAGAAGSGKTTVIASIYERFCKGPFPGLLFAGSRTLLGFEQICHLNRLASGGSFPDTPRTIPADEAAYFHLALRENKVGALRRNVLLSAVSGELFRLAKNSREDCHRLTFLLRANTIVILVDGARLADPRTRTKAQTEASSLLESFLDAHMIGNHCQIEFVFSKLDRVLEAGSPAIAFLERTQEKFLAQFESRLSNLVFRRIAARPDQLLSIWGVDDGMADAFSSWIKEMPQVGSEGWMRDAPPLSSREFSKFGWRYSLRSKQEES